MSDTLDNVIKAVVEDTYDEDTYKLPVAIDNSLRWVKEYKEKGFIVVDAERVEISKEGPSISREDYVFDRISYIGKVDYIERLGRNIDNPKSWVFFILLNKILIRVSLEDGSIINDTPQYELGRMLTSEDEDTFLGMLPNVKERPESIPLEEREQAMADLIRVKEKEASFWRVINVVVDSLVLLFVVGVMIFLARLSL